MRPPPSGRVVDTAGSLHPQQWWIRSSIPAGALVFLGCVPIAGGDFHPFLSVLTLLLAVVAILTPESPLTLLVLGGLLGLWFASVHDALTPWVLAAVPAVVVVHVAATLASYGPSGMVLAPSLIRLWVRRGLGLVGVGWLLWVVARLASVPGLAPSGWLYGVALLLVVGWVGFLLVRLGAGARSHEYSHE